MKIAFDLDGTLCEEVPHSEKFFAKPIKKEIDNLNKLYKFGHHIVIFSARSWNEYNLTKKWLDDNNVKYHQIILGKYNFDILIDDKSLITSNDLIELKYA